MSNHTQVAIIGASFAGLATYRTIKNRTGADVKLFDLRDKFTWIPGLHEVLYQPQRLKSLQFDLTSVFKQDFINQKVTEIKPKVLHTADGQTWTFDYAVIATGSRTNFRGNTDFEQYCHTVRYPDDVLALNKVLPNARTVSVVGGGFTGIEIASILAHRSPPNTQVRLIHNGSRLVERLSPYTSNTAATYLKNKGVELIFNNKLTGVTHTHITLADGTELRSDVTILSAGIQINDEQHRPFLNFTGGYEAEESPDIYLCGDVAIHGLYTTAHNAILEGRRVGHLIADKIIGITKTYPPLHNRDKLAITLGAYNGIMTIGKRGIYIPGFTGIAKRIIEKKVILEFKTGYLLPF